MRPKKIAVALLLLSASFTAVADDACPATGSEKDRVAYLTSRLDALKAESDAKKKEQEEWLELIRAKLKLDGKWSENVGKTWSRETMSDTGFVEHQSNIARHLKQYDASLLSALSDPQAPCSQIEATISSLQAVQAETLMQYKIMTDSMLALSGLPFGNDR